MILHESSSLAPLQQADLAVDKLLHESTGSSMTIKPGRFLKPGDLQSYVCSVFAIFNKSRSHFFIEHPDPKANILIGGDKGGPYKKIHVEISAPGIILFVSNVHIIAIYKALDSRQNILKILEPFDD